MSCIALRPERPTPDFQDVVCEGDTVVINGGGVFKAVAAKKGNSLRLGRVGSVALESLIGLRFGDVVQFDEKTKRFVTSDEHPDLDKTQIAADVDEVKDNRFLEDTCGAAQQLTHAEVTALKQERGVDGLLEQLVESSATFATKTAFSQEKYIRKKMKKYALLFKVERLTPDNSAEMQIPTIAPSDQPLEDSRWIKLRCDTLALLLHHADIHSASRVLCYDKTNGVLPAAILNRLGSEGMLYQIMDRVSHPNIVTARQMQLPSIKERWRAVPRNQPFFTGVEYETSKNSNPTVAEASGEPVLGDVTASTSTSGGQWIKGKAARDELLKSPADALVVADDENAAQVVIELLPFLSLSGHVVVFSNFLDQLTDIFKLIRNDCVCIHISETWYRHHQVLSNRTHPTVNMSTAGGYLLTAVKVEHNAAPRPRYAVLHAETHEQYSAGFSDLSKGKKRDRDE